MPPETYKVIGTSVCTPLEFKQPREIRIPRPLTNYTLLYHYGDLDKTPVRGVSYFATLADGQTREGLLDDYGQAYLSQVAAGPVKVVYQHDEPDADTPEIVAARTAIREALEAIVQQTRQDMADEWQEWNEAGWLKRHYLLKIHEWKGDAVGAWEWLSGTVQTFWQLAVLLYRTDREIRELRHLILLGQWAQLDQKIAGYRARGEKVMGAASEVKELLILVFNDEKTRDLIKAFPAQWWAAIPPDEQAELEASVGTQIAVDVIIAVLLAAFSAGAAGAVYGSAKWTERIGKLGSKVVKQLDRLQEAFGKLAKALKTRKRRRVDQRSANAKKEIETVWKPEPKPVGTPGEEFALVNGKKVFPQLFNKLFHGTNKATLGFSEATPAEEVAAHVYKHGLPARGDNIDLAAHAENAADRAFRGATQQILSPDGNAGAILWADEGGLLIELKKVKGYDLNPLLEGRVQNPMGTFGGNKMHGEIEISVPGAIKPEQVETVSVVVRNARGRLIPKKLDRPPKGHE